MIRRKIWLLLPATLIAAAAGTWYYWGAPATVAAPQRPPPIIPVTTTLVQRQDVPIFLSGIGTVRAFNIVTVKTRVDGHLESIAFVEGQEVAEGDLLAQIDPRSFRAQLHEIKHDGFRITGSAFYRLALACGEAQPILSGAPKAERKAAPKHIINVSYPGLCSIEQHI